MKFHVAETKLCGTVVGFGLGIFAQTEVEEQPNLDEVYGTFCLLWYLCVRSYVNDQPNGRGGIFLFRTRVNI